MRAFATFTLALTLTLMPAALLTGCGGGGDSDVRLVGRVLDDGTLRPVAGARVSATGGPRDLTDATGAFDFGGGPATGTVTVTAAGYQSLTVSYGGGGEIDLGTLYLIPAAVAGTGNISGTITSGSGVVGGATVRAAGREARTRTSGVYRLYNVPAGFQTVFAVSPDSQTSGSRGVDVIVGTTVTADIQLTIQPPSPPSG